MKAAGTSAVPEPWRSVSLGFCLASKIAAGLNTAMDTAARNSLVSLAAWISGEGFITPGIFRSAARGGRLFLGYRHPHVDPADEDSLDEIGRRCILPERLLGSQ
jgi:hypothetical protein